MNTLTVTSLTQELVGTFLLSVITFIVAMVLTPLYTSLAYRYKFWKKQRDISTIGEKLLIFVKLRKDTLKSTIPTMAGVVGVAAVAIVTIGLNLDWAQSWLPLAALIGGAAVGLLDDIINIRGQGMSVARLRSIFKFLTIPILGVALGWWFFTTIGVDAIYVPFIGDLEVGWLIIPIFAFAVVAIGNAVTMSDGLDGLIGGLLAASFGAFGLIALLQGQFILAGFCFTVIGALLAYLWFNIYPARFFMGSVGGLAFGTSLGVVAMMTNSFFLIPIIGILFVIEAGSSIIQIFSKKVFHRKVFLSVPLHRHLEAKGWPETKVTMCFWVIACVAASAGVMVALAGGHISGVGS